MSDRGLREIVAAQTRLSDIDGQAGRLWYVGYDIHDLAGRTSYEEVVHLLHELRLPNQKELDRLTDFMIEEREVSKFLRDDLMPTLAQQTSPMSMLRTSVSAASAYDPDGWDDSADADRRKALRLIAKTPTLLAMYHRMRTGQEIVPPNTKLPHAANFLHMLLGLEPSKEDAEVIDTTFVLYADHTMNASTFTARIVASTLADMFSAITAAIAALKGPLHGGANEESMKMLEEVGSPDRAEAYVRDRLERHQKVMGFGHAVYKTMDPRAVVLKRLSQGDRRAARRHVLVRDLRGDRAHRRRAEGSVPERRLLRRERVPHARHPDRPHDADLRDRADGGMDGPRPRTVRGQPRDPARIGVHRTPRPVVGPDRRAVGPAQAGTGGGDGGAAGCAPPVAAASQTRFRCSCT